MTTAPEDPATLVSVIVPVLDEPPTTDVGEKLRLDSVAAVTVSELLADDGPRLAVNASVTFVETTEEETVKVALAAPAAMDTVAG